MTSPISALVARGKVERAKTQTHELQKAVKAFFDSNTYEVVSKLNSDATQQAWAFHFENAPPIEFSILAGEALHNLRSALDQIVGAIAIQHTGTGKGTYFPFGKTKQIFETEVRRKTKKLPADAVDIIRGLKPYPGGNDLLWAIHDMNRGDKHVLDVVPVKAATGALMGALMVRNSDLVVMGNRHGQHLATPTGHAAIADGPHPIFEENDYEFLTLRPGGEFQCEAEPTFNVAFRQIPGLERESAIAVLHQMRNLAERILLTFERRFFL